MNLQIACADNASQMVNLINRHI